MSKPLVDPFPPRFPSRNTRRAMPASQDCPYPKVYQRPGWGSTNLKKTARVGIRKGEGRGAGPNCYQALFLQGVGGMLRRFSGNRVLHPKKPMNMRKGALLDFGKIVIRQTKPIHARINVQNGRKFLPDRLAESVPFITFFTEFKTGMYLF